MKKLRSDAINLVGQRFDRLLVMERMPNLGNTYQSVWRVRCDCGNEKFGVLYGALMSGKTRSCGCLRKEKLKERFDDSWSHSRHPLYGVWTAMHQRCNDKNQKCYPSYGGRGIKVCERWSDFQSFVQDVGEKPEGTSLDRIDVNGDYEPGNCRWASPVMQAQNRRECSSLFQLEWNGEVLCLKEICRRENVGYSRVRERVRNGISLKDAVLKTRFDGVEFIEDAKTLMPENQPESRREDFVKRQEKQRKKWDGDFKHVGNKPDHGDEVRRENRRLRKCIEKCRGKGVQYRGSLPSDWNPEVESI